MQPTTGADFAGDERWVLVTRVAASRLFCKAGQLRELLRFLAEKAIASPDVEITEQEIGSRVLGRRPDYDPQSDNIVRVQIRRLRQKLEEYFVADGLHEPMVIAIPKGSHVLRFERRPEQDRGAPPVALSPPRASRWLGAAAAILGVAAIAFFLGRFSIDRSESPAGKQGEASASPLWARLFLRDQPTTIVIADSSLVFVQNVLRTNIALNEYIDRSYRERIEAVAEAGLRDALRMISTRQYTSLADAIVSGELRSIGVRLGAKVTVRYSRHMNIRDFNAGNFVLVGSRHSVPWVELFEPGLNFQFERIGKEPRFGIRNKKPADGEAAVYGNAAAPSGSQESFATISLMPNLAHTGTVLMLSGVTMEATEAAGEFSMSNDFPQFLAKTFGASTARNLPYFEILLKTAAISGAPHKADVVAWRRLN